MRVYLPFECPFGFCTHCHLVREVVEIRGLDLTAEKQIAAVEHQFQRILIQLPKFVNLNLPLEN